MAFVRRVRTGSGATAVQVVKKREGKLVIIEHVGSAHTEVELALLMERAHRVLQGDQGMLDLGLDQALAVSLVGKAEPPAANGQTQKFPAYLPDDVAQIVTQITGKPGH